MTTTTIRSVPRELTKADIYLDQLFEVESVLEEAFSKLPEPQNVSFEYRVNDDLRMTTHNDLIAHGGESSSFALLVTTESNYLSSQSVVSLYGGLNPTIDFPYQLREYAWPIYAQIQQIFEARTSKLRKVVEQIPRSVLYGLDGALTAIGALVVLPLLVAAAIRHAANVAILFSIPAFVLLYLPVLILVRVDKREAKIYFRHQRDDEKQRKSVRKEWVGKVAILILGAIFGVIGTWITHALGGAH